MPAGKPLERRTPLPRAGAPGRTRPRRAGTDPGRAARREAEALVRRGCAERDRGCRLSGAAGTGPCAGRLTFHHLRKASQGGPYAPHNGLTLCVAHNEWVETDPITAHAWGLRLLHGEHHLQAWARLHLAGIVWWWWDGTPCDRPDPITREEDPCG